MHKPGNQYGGDMWGAIQDAHRRIDELGEKLGSIKEDIATIKASMLTEEKLLRLLDRDRREETTYRDWSSDRYQQLRSSPVEQREQRNSQYMAEQTRSSQSQVWVALATPFLSMLLSILAVHLFK